MRSRHPNTEPDKRATGRRYEELAERYLAAHGLERIARNYTCRGGEVDLVMRERDTLVFVEVRYRRSGAYGGAAASVTREKQRRLVRAARHYLLAEVRGNEPLCRFDVVAMEGHPERPEIDWIAGAFSA